MGNSLKGVKGKKFVIEVFSDRDEVDRIVEPSWRETIWTRGPVLKRAVDKALLRAETAFPMAKYRIREVK